MQTKGKTSHILFVPFGICGTSVKSSQATSLSADNLICDLFISLQRRREVLLLLLDVVEGLVNIILFTFRSQNCSVESTQLQEQIFSFVVCVSATYLLRYFRSR